jgi:hypothetical protein
MKFVSIFNIFLLQSSDEIYLYSVLSAFASKPPNSSKRLIEFSVLYFLVNSVICVDQYQMYSSSVLLSLIFLMAYPKTIAEEQWQRSIFTFQTLLDMKCIRHMLICTKFTIRFVSPISNSFADLSSNNIN